MPIYDYRCPHCGPFEHRGDQRTAGVSVPCPVCGLASERRIGAPAVHRAEGGLARDLRERVDAGHPRVVEKRAAELGMGFARAATAGPDPRFADMVVELMAEHTADVPVRRLSTIPSAGCTVNGLPCAPDCCMSRRPR